MSHPPRLSHAELAAARQRQDWGLLWEQAIPLAKLAVRRLMEKGSLAPGQSTEDLMQDALLAAGLAVRKWQPEKGAFSTWVMARARGQVLDSLAACNSGMIGGRRSGLPVVSMHGEGSTAYEGEDDAEDAAELQYEHTPEGLGDPLEEAARVEAGEQALLRLASLPADAEELVASLYGVGRTKETVEQFARRKRLAIRTVKYRLADALSALHSAVVTGDTCTH